MPSSSKMAPDIGLLGTDFKKDRPEWKPVLICLNLLPQDNISSGDIPAVNCDCPIMVTTQGLSVLQ